TRYVGRSRVGPSVSPLRGVGASRLRLRRRCGARRGGSVTRSGIGTLAERIRFAQRTVHGRSPLTGIARYEARSASSERAARALPAGSDDLTKHAGSTTSAAEPQSAGVDSKARPYDWTHHDSRGEAASWTLRVQGGEAGAVICGFVRGQAWSGS